MKVLIVEDEMLSAEFLKLTLQELNHTVIATVDDAVDCETILRENIVDLVLMDINIKGAIDGLQLAHIISKNYLAKIIFITSYNDSQTIKEAALSSPIGYLIKPMIKSTIEATMMVASNAICTQSIDQTKDKKIFFGALSYDLRKKIFMRGKNVIALSRLETKALEVLLSNLNKAVSSEQLIYTLWKEEKSKTSLRELLSRLRKKLPELKLQNYSNVGYILYSN